ncbi:hypothetical protein LshimejAT787_1402320 [Lyophyllum shimeji]|uniref:Uncharacterized protein n=1 Tax=Lyophyllum shimeji TaxID=47721 RepID=A0A9P3UTK9_LYOSH|nr:hypothetical protein LshimejAT787_1402320 [Lyophyllum shimeji]
MSTTEPVEPGSEGRDEGDGKAQVDNQMEDSTAAKAESSNVIGQPGTGAVNVLHDSSPEQHMRSPPLAVSMPRPDDAFHSPSSQFVGTPFTTESRFEYPFPDISSTRDASSTTLNASLPSLSLSASPAFPSSSSSHFLSLSSSPPSTITKFPPTFLPADRPSYSPKHPKMRLADAPVPPGLAKKRQRWSRNLLRRRSSSGSSSQGSPASESSVRSAPRPSLTTVELSVAADQRQPRLREATSTE